MKKYFLITGLMMAMQPGAIAQIETSSSSALVADEPKWVRGESEIDEADLSKMPFDAYLTGAGYVVYPVEENIALLQTRITRNPMILQKDFIPRRVRVVRQVNGESAEGSRSGSPKQFAIVSEIGSATVFMVNKKDLHFIQNKVSEASEAK